MPRWYLSVAPPTPADRVQTLIIEADDQALAKSLATSVWESACIPVVGLNVLRLADADYAVRKDEGGVVWVRKAERERLGDWRRQ